VQELINSDLFSAVLQSRIHVI